jgi:hypothetical protein
MTFQPVPPHDHWRNLVEKAIQTFKDHYITILCRADKSFPLNLWDRLLPRTEHTLNMLRPSQMTPTISTYAYLWKQHNYNANPFAPLGCKVEAHLVPTNHETWVLTQPVVSTLATHGITTAATRSTSNNTQHTCTCNTVFFKHKYLTMPTLTPADALIQAVDNLTLAIASVVPPPNMTTDAIDQLMHIFEQQAETTKNDAAIQRVLKERTHTERVLTKAEPNLTPTTTPSSVPTAKPTTTFPELEIEYPVIDVGQPRRTPVVSEDH